MSRLKWLLAGAALIVFVAAVGVYRLGTASLYKTFDVQPAPVDIPTDAAAIARGRHLAWAVAVCVVCHGEDMAGRLAFDDPLIGRVVTPNLTSGRGGVGGYYTDTDWVRAIRHGVAPGGRGLFFMPVDYYYHLSDEDLGALIAYLKSLPPVDGPGRRFELTFVGRFMISSGLSGQLMRAEVLDHTGPRPAPPAGEGAYLVTIAGCTFCHGEALTGGQGPEPGAPPGPDLTRAGRLSGWSLDQFQRALRAGVTPEGRVIDPRFMPWQGYQYMTDEEVELIWNYLQSLPTD
jgi:mono/diheme cytochrome c family protein